MSTHDDLTSAPGKPRPGRAPGAARTVQGARQPAKVGQAPAASRGKQGTSTSAAITRRFPTPKIRDRIQTLLDELLSPHQSPVDVDDVISLSAERIQYLANMLSGGVGHMEATRMSEEVRGPKIAVVKELLEAILESEVASSWLDEEWVSIILGSWAGMFACTPFRGEQGAGAATSADVEDSEDSDEQGQRGGRATGAGAGRAKGGAQTPKKARAQQKGPVYTPPATKVAGQDKPRASRMTAQEREEIEASLTTPAIVLEGRRRNDRARKRAEEEEESEGDDEGVSPAMKKVRRQITRAEWQEMYPSHDDQWPSYDQYHSPQEIMAIARDTWGGQDRTITGKARSKPGSIWRHEMAPEAFTYAGTLRSQWWPYRKAVDRKTGEQILTDEQIAKICPNINANHETYRATFNANGWLYQRKLPEIEQPRDPKTARFVAKTAENVQLSKLSKEKILTALLTDERGIANLRAMDSEALGGKITAHKDELLKERAQARVEIGRSMELQERETEFIRAEVKRRTLKYQKQITEMGQEQERQLDAMQSDIRRLTTTSERLRREKAALATRVAELEEAEDEYVEEALRQEARIQGLQEALEAELRTAITLRESLASEDEQEE